MPATTKAKTAKIAAAETFTDAEVDSGQLAQVLAALTGLTTKFAGMETTVSEISARQVALESAHITGTGAAAAVLAEPELEPGVEPEPAPRSRERRWGEHRANEPRRAPCRNSHVKFG